MSQPFKLELHIAPLWETIHEIRDKMAVDERIRKHGEELVQATAMVASELLENAIKYGYNSPDGEGVRFTLDITDKEVVVSVLNGVAPNHSLEGLKGILDRIKGSANPMELYTERLMAIANNPKGQESGLGLYRIAYEGEFKLQYEITDKAVKIIARRMGRAYVPQPAEAGHVRLALV